MVPHQWPCCARQCGSPTIPLVAFRRPFQGQTGHREAPLSWPYGQLVAFRNLGPAIYQLSLAYYCYLFADMLGLYVAKIIAIDIARKKRKAIRCRSMAKSIICYLAWIVTFVATAIFIYNAGKDNDIKDLRPSPTSPTEVAPKIVSH